MPAGNIAVSSRELEAKKRLDSNARPVGHGTVVDLLDGANGECSLGAHRSHDRPRRLRAGPMS